MKQYARLTRLKAQTLRLQGHLAKLKRLDSARKTHRFFLTPQQLIEKRDKLVARLEATDLPKNRRKRLKAELAEVSRAIKDPGLVVDPKVQQQRRERDKQRRAAKKLARKKELVKEIKKQKRKLKKCLNCGKNHSLAECPVGVATVCYRCGSTTHSLKDCKETGPLQFSLCFVCGEKGHISRECPKNEKGMYRYGGGCWQCGGNDHTRANCPEVGGVAVPQEGEEF